MPPLGIQPIVLGKKYRLAETRVLDLIAELGLHGIECSSTEPIAFRHELERRNLRHIGQHVSASKLLDIAPIIEQAQLLGGKDVCNSGLFDWHARSAEDLKLTVAILNRAGKLLRAEGIHLHYHNHDFEFTESVGGVSIMDYFINELNPDYCDLCVDVGWVKKAGQDPVAFLQKHKAIVGYLHLKDFDDDGWCEAGRGHVDWPALMQIIPQLPNVRFAMLEQDSTRNDPLDSIRWSRTYFKQTFGY